MLTGRSQKAPNTTNWEEPTEKAVPGPGDSSKLTDPVSSRLPPVIGRAGHGTGWGTALDGAGVGVSHRKTAGRTGEQFLLEGYVLSKAPPLEVGVGTRGLEKLPPPRLILCLLLWTPGGCRRGDGAEGSRGR